MLTQPADPVMLSAEEGEVLIAQVHQRNLPAAVAGRLEQIIRTCFWLVFALPETQMTVKRLRRLLFGKSYKPSPVPGDSCAPSPAGGDETYAPTGSLGSSPRLHDRAVTGEDRADRIFRGLICPWSSNEPVNGV